MRDIKLGLALAGLFMMGTGTAMAQGRIGVINLPQLFAEAPQADAARRDLQREFGSRQRSLQAKEQKLVDQQEKLKRDGPVMSATERARAEQRFLDDQKSFRREAEDLQQDLNRRQQELFATMQKGIGESLVDLAKQEGYDVILGEGVLWAADSADLTDKLLKILQKEYAQNGGRR